MHYGTRGAVIYLPLLLLLLKPSYRKLVWQIVASAAATMLLVDEILKPLIKESRPFETLHNVFILPPLPTSFSFPSSETAAAAAIVTSLIINLPGKHKHWLWLWVVLIGIDRIYMGHHYPVDVLAGAALGIGMAIVVKMMFKQIHLN
jgi:undecaprenyl-diphosphatase